MRFGLQDNIIEKINNVFSSFQEIEEAIIYGSRAKGNFKTGSDIDFVLKGEKLNHTILNKIILKLDDLFLPYSIDISLFKHIDNSHLTDHINRIGKNFYYAPSSNASSAA